MPEKSELEVKRPVTKMAKAALRVSNTDISKILRQGSALGGGGLSSRCNRGADLREQKGLILGITLLV
jgi:hypothetical protein